MKGERGGRLKAELVVVGGGPAGYTAAIRASQRGASVTVLENEKVGGACLHKGCIPTRVLLEGIRRKREIDESRIFGVLASEVRFELATLKEHRDATIEYMYAGLKKLLRDYGIRVKKGTGKIIRPRSIRIEETGETIDASAIILAVGAESRGITAPGAKAPYIMDSDQALLLDRVPEKLVVVGAGYIGLEFAQIYAALGSQVSILEMRPQIIPEEDLDIAEMLRSALQKQMLDIHCNVVVEEFREKRNGVVVVYSENGKRKELSSQAVLLATGRRSKTTHLGLDTIGIRIENENILVDERMETSIPGVFAAGDCIGGYMLAHMAFREAEIAAINATGGESKMNPEIPVPRCLYTDPEVACVGLTEFRARELYGDEVRVGRYPLIRNGLAKAIGQKVGVAKVITLNYDIILGIQLVGPRVTENIGICVTAINLEATTEDLATFVFPHPTISEIISEAAADALGKCLSLPPKNIADHLATLSPNK